MPAQPARPVRSRPARDAATVPPARRAAAPAAAGVNPFSLPKRAHDLTGRALSPLREQGFAAWLDARRAAVAALLRLALDRGALAEAEVHAALDGPHRHERLYALFCQAWRGLPAWIEAIARRHALDPARWPDWRPFVEMEWREDATGGRLVLTACSDWPHTFDLDGLPPALAVAVAQTLDLIGMRLTECVPVRDLAEPWWDEAQAAYETLRATGLTDPAALWAHVETATDFLQWFGWNGPEEFEQWWAETASFCEPAPVWLWRWLAQRNRAYCPAFLRRLTRRLWRWRRRPEIASLPWFRWLRRAALTLRRCARRWPEPPVHAAMLDPEDDSEPLACAQPLGFGEPWEDSFLEDYYANAASGGNGFSRPLRCEALAWEGLRDTLEAFAIGQGLLIGAVQADEARSEVLKG